jgi:hypothetical protein
MEPPTPLIDSDDNRSEITSISKQASMAEALHPQTQAPEMNGGRTGGYGSGHGQDFP